MRNLCRLLLVPKIGFRFTEEPKNKSYATLYGASGEI